MNTPRAKVAVNELVFSLYQRPLHPELFSISEKRHIRTEKYEVIIWVTDCSHVVSVFAKQTCLSELISTPNQPLPKRCLIERFQFRGQRSHKCTLSHGLSYITDFQVEKMSANLYRQSHYDLERFARNRGVFVNFSPSPVGGLEPFSYIDFEARRTDLHVHAFHAYPDQLTIIKTQSLFDIH